MKINGIQMTCLIVDDESPAQRVLEKFINDLSTLTLIGKCKNVFEASAILQSQKIDLMFLDINMPKMSGLDFLRTIKNPPLVIITTAYREYALEGFELDVVDYLQKPFSFERFFTAANKAVERYRIKNSYLLTNSSVSKPVESEFIFLRADKIDYKININDILFLESIGDYVKVHTVSRTYMVYQTLKNFENLFSCKAFIRVHKSFIVPFSRIDSIEGNMIKIGRDIVLIGSTYRKTFFEALQGFRSLK
jgi:DNA-binding LytR/AlgR family response regulator